MKLSIMECRHCGAAYWWPAAEPAAVDGGPCCFGREVLDVTRYPTEQAARRAFPAWERRRLDALRKAWRLHHPRGAAA